MVPNSSGWGYGVRFIEVGVWTYGAQFIEVGIWCPIHQGGDIVPDSSR